MSNNSIQTALILNSGTGSRLGELTRNAPKCLTPITSQGDTILSRQLKILAECGISEVIITTGPFSNTLETYCSRLKLPLLYKFVNNPIYSTTNYIYSIYLAREHLKKNILLLHGDLVFERDVPMQITLSKESCMVVSSTKPLPNKDFKAVIENDIIREISIDFFDKALAAQPFYKLLWKDWSVWLSNIEKYCELKQTNVYAENAFNDVSRKLNIFALDTKDLLCAEIDTHADLKVVGDLLK